VLKHPKVTIAVTLFALVMALLALRSHEPTYRNRSLSRWLQAPGTVEAQEAVRRIGTNAIPYALHWLGHQPSLFESVALGMRNKLPQHLRPSPITSSDSRAGDAENCFLMLGPLAAPAIPDLTRLALTPPFDGRPERCIRCLSYIGSSAMPSLLGIATNSTPDSRCYAFEILAWQCKTNPASFVPILIASLDDTNTEVAAAAARQLGKLSPPQPAVVPALINKLNTQDLAVRFNVIGALRDIGPPARSALQDLQRLEASDRATAAWAKLAVERIAPDLLTNTPAQ
jgi:hypothetical protein